MEETQPLEDCALEELAGPEEASGRKGEPLAKLRVFKNDHFPETEFPLFLGENVLGRDPSSCSFPLPARSVSKQHAVISLTLFPDDGRRGDVVMEALLWDLGSMNGTRKGRFRLTPHVRYALSEGESVVLADLPCQYITVEQGGAGGKTEAPIETEAVRGRGRGKRGGRGRGRGLGRRAGMEKDRGVEVDVGGAKNITEKRAEGRRLEIEVMTPNMPRAKPLTLEQTPKQPEMTLVPESESDSDGERGGRRERRAQMLVSDSESPQGSGPTCSTFLSPSSKIIPESDDEGSITASPSVHSRSEQRVSVSETEREESDKLKNKKKRPQVIADDSDLEDSTVLGGALVEKAVCEGEGWQDNSHQNKTPNLIPTPISDSDPDMKGLGEPGHKTSQLGSGPDLHSRSTMNKENVEPNSASAAADLRQGVPDLNMGSDTDEEEKVGHLSSSAGVKAVLDSSAPLPAVNHTEFHLDSDTDVEDEVDSVTRSASVLESNADAVITVPTLKPSESPLDSDTDLEGNGEDPSTLPPGGKSNTSKPKAVIAKPQELHLDSDTDAEDADANPPSTAALVSDAKVSAHVAGTGLEILSDSDTDMEQDVTELCAPAAEVASGSQPNSLPATASTAPAVAPPCPEPDSDTDVEDSGSGRPQSPPKAVPNPSHWNLDSDTDVEEEVEEGTTGRVEEAGGSSGTKDVGLSAPSAIEPKCSTPLAPVAMEEELETQAFVCPSDPFMRPSVPPRLKPKGLQNVQEDSKEEVFVAETQCFVSDSSQSSHLGDPALEPTQMFASDPSLGDSFEDQPTQAFSFQMGVSDSSHEQAEATECALAFGQAKGQAEVEPGSAQADSTEMDLDVAPTQAYVSSPPRRGSAETEEDEELDATQAYTGEVQTRTVTEEGETQPMEHPSDYHLSTADTQPISALENRVGVREEEEEEEEVEDEEEEEETESKPQKQRGKPQRGRAKEQVAGSSRSSRSRRKDGGEEEAECLEPPKRQTRGKSKAEKPTRGGRRGTVIPQVAEGSEEEEDRATEDNSRGVGKRKGKSRTQQRGHSEDTIRLDKEQREREEREQREREEKEQRGREERERLEREQREREERERLEREQREREEKEQKEREEREQKEREERERLEREQREREERERLEREQREREEREQREREEKEQKEREERERLEREQREREEREQLEREQRERRERERLEREQREREEKEQREREEREQREREEREQREKEEREQREREERERLEREQREREERERLEREQREREEREQREREEREQREREERERLEREEKEKERLARERKEQAEKERLEMERKQEEEQKEAEERLENEKQKREQREREEKERAEKEESEKKQKPSTRARRQTRGRASVAPTVTEGEPELHGLSAMDPSSSELTPGPGVRSRSSSISSVSSEQSTASTRSQRRGRGRPSQRRAEPETDTVLPSDGKEEPPTPKSSGRGRKSHRVGVSASLEKETDREPVQPENAEEDSLKQNATRGRSRARKLTDTPATKEDQTEVFEEPQSVETPAPKASGRGRTRGRKPSGSDSTVVDQTTVVTETQTAETVAPKTSGRGKGRARKVSDSDPTAMEEGQSTTAVEAQNEDEDVPKGNGRNRGRKRGLEGGTEEKEEASSFKVPRGKAQRTARGAKEEQAGAGEVEENKSDPSPVPKMERAPSTHGQKKELQVDMEMEGEKKKEEACPSVQKTSRGRQTAAQRKKEAEEDEKEESMSTMGSEEQDVPQTPTGGKSRKRVAPSESTPTAKTPRRSVTCAPSPGTGGRGRAVSQSPKVLFTGVTDEAGEAVVARLGGSMAKGVNDMTHLVTDKVRRTVKFLCAVARGVPIVTTVWLEKSGKSGSFLSPSAFLVKDVEQEKKFSFCLEESLSTAHSQPLLQGYEIHVTRSVKPDPAQMKDIISCSGARYLPKMPSVAKPQTVVISCLEDAHLCGPALSASLPVLSAEFLLTGILQQKVDLQMHVLPAQEQELELALKGGSKGKRKK